MVSLRFEDTSSKDTGSEALRSQRPPAELFTDYYQTRRKAAPEPQLVALFERLYREASTASDEP